jgi:molybdopterin molybdotransferase
VRSVDDHLALCLAAVEPLPALDVALLDAVDALLVEDVASTVSVPSFDNSSMDGYAVLAADLELATPDHPITLPVVGDLPAGSPQQLRLTQGSAIRIMTGAPAPLGADAVVPVEVTDAGVASVQIYARAEPGAYLRRIGEDVRAGDVVLRAGVRLTPRHIGLLAAIGRDRVLVRPQPRVVVIATGSELVEPGRVAGFGQIHNSNGYALTAAAAELGAVAHHVGIVPDDPQQLITTLEDQLVRADLVITSGGVSAGAFDTVKEVLSTLGTVTFTQVAMQPGMPQGFGALTALGGREVPIFTLPGNPVSSAVSFEVFVRPVLRKLRGETTLHRHAVAAKATRDWRSPQSKKQFVRAVLERRTDGNHQVTPVGGQGSHLVADLAHANCLAVVPEGVDQVKAGDLLDCLLLDRVRR